MHLRRTFGSTLLLTVTVASLALISPTAASAATLVSARAFTAPDAPGSVTAVALQRQTTGTLSWSPPASSGDSALTGYHIDGLPTGSTDVDSSVTSLPITGLVPGQSYVIDVHAVNASGPSLAGETTLYVDTWVPTTAPTMQVFMEGAKMIIAWTPPANPGNAQFTDWRVTVNGQVFDEAPGYQGLALSNPGNGAHSIKLQLLGSADLGSVTPTRTASFTVGATPPRIGKAVSGRRGGPSTASIHWGAPSSNGGYPITGYKAIALKLNSHGQVVRVFVTRMLKPGVRSFNGRLPRGRYKFQVVAYNALGATRLSGYSKVVSAR